VLVRSRTTSATSIDPSITNVKEHTVITFNLFSKFYLSSNNVKHLLIDTYARQAAGILVKLTIKKSDVTNIQRLRKIK